MTAPPTTVRVELGDRSYDAVVGAGILPELGRRVSELGIGTRCAIITDSNVGPLYAKTVEGSLTAAGLEVAATVEVPAGEGSKSMACTEDCCRQMIRAGLDRRSFVVALGGGVVGDLAGFVAAVFYRGIPFVQVATSVVAQVDSSVGGKTGVNAPEGKNLIGAFHQPRLVLADVRTLDTLSPRDYNEGFAEIIKHAAIRDAEMFPLIAAAKEDRGRLTELVARNIAIKAAVVAEDERETTGTRALLNFGHTLGHGVEAAAGYGGLLHGEAISIGLVAAADLSVEAAGLASDAADEIKRHLASFDLPLTLPENIEQSEVLSLLERDKKFLDGEVRFVLLRALGDAFVSDAISREQIAGALARLT